MPATTDEALQHRNRRVLPVKAHGRSRGRPTAGAIQTGFLIAGLWAAPASIAVSEILLGAALVVRLWQLAYRREHLSLPGVFRYWLIFAALEAGSWALSPQPRAGVGELRHLGIAAALFVLLPALDTTSKRLIAWGGFVAVGTVSSLVLVVQFAYKLGLSGGGFDPVYLRGGGLLHHWMIYAAVEIVVFAGLLEFCRRFAEHRRWIAVAIIINIAAIVVSLTRILWIGCLLLLALELIWMRSRWVWALPALPFALFLLAPAAVRARVTESFDPAYYSNAERIQMLRVGWRMVRDKPLAGVGPGRVEELYPRYLRPSEPLPRYHGHLHDNAAQIAAQSGVPALGAALILFAMLLRDLVGRERSEQDSDSRFISRAGVLALIGFAVVGLTDYNYGHSLGLIAIGFAALTPLLRTNAADGGATIHRSLRRLTHQPV